MQEIVETEGYLAAAEKAGMTEEDRDAVIEYVARNPKAGDIVKGSGGVRKVRIARPGMGKSGGWRVLTAYVAEAAPTFLLWVYAKNRHANIPADRLKELAKLMKALKGDET